MTSRITPGDVPVHVHRQKPYRDSASYDVTIGLEPRTTTSRGISRWGRGKPNVRTYGKLILAKRVPPDSPQIVRFLLVASTSRPRWRLIRVTSRLGRIFLAASCLSSTIKRFSTYSMEIILATLFCRHFPHTFRINVPAFIVFR